VRQGWGAKLTSDGHRHGPQHSDHDLSGTSIRPCFKRVGPAWQSRRVPEGSCRSPLARVGTPDDVATPCCSCHDMSAWITGFLWWWTEAAGLKCSAIGTPRGLVPSDPCSPNGVPERVAIPRRIPENEVSGNSPDASRRNPRTITEDNLPMRTAS